MRPQSIVQFEIVFFALLASTAGVQLLGLGAEASPAAALVALVIWGLIQIALWYLIARRANGIAKWIYAALFLFGLGGLLVLGMAGMIAGGLAAVTGIALTLLNALSVYLLFQPDSREWFARR